MTFHLAHSLFSGVRKFVICRCCRTQPYLSKNVPFLTPPPLLPPSLVTLFTADRTERGREGAGLPTFLHCSASLERFCHALTSSEAETEERRLSTSSAGAVRIDMIKVGQPDPERDRVPSGQSSDCRTSRKLRQTSEANESRYLGRP